jgi:NAD(P)-dependent dehydrogenase (short-subunit alcohol dehydrogenase family)
MPSSEMPTFRPEDIARAIALLEALAVDRELLAGLPAEERRALLVAAGRISRPSRDEQRRMRKALRRRDRAKAEAHDRDLRATTEIRTARHAEVFVPPPRLVAGAGAALPESAEGAAGMGAAAAAAATDAAGSSPRVLEKPRNCYVCKAPFVELHFFYDAMCPACAERNYAKRFQTASLEGRVALITGARIKIGYQAALMMLRAGARVLVTTRFPRDAAARYAREPDFERFRDRLEVHGLDLRHAPSVELFARHLCMKEERLDILVNNAAQTVRRPPAFYAHLAELEERPFRELPASVRPLLASHEHIKESMIDDPPLLVGIRASAMLAKVPCAYDDTTQDEALFPAGRFDQDLQQVDLRTMNSWRMRLADVPSPEMLEVQLVNAVAPFILCSKLKPLMRKTDNRDKHVVNVSAMEGQFSRGTKTDKHPHTNMAKAALNMLTLTSARDYARDGIHMNAVDTGWVTDEDPSEISRRKQERHDFQPPLDIVDGAARVCDPFFSGLLTGVHVFGKFLKDYAECAW